MLTFLIFCAVLVPLAVLLFAVKFRIDLRVTLVLDPSQALLDLDILPLGRERWRQQHHLQIPSGQLFEQLIEKVSQKNQRYQPPGWFSSLSRSQKAAFIQKMLPVAYRFVHNVSIKELRWRSFCGGEDPMQAALRTGTLWAVKGIVLAVVSSLCRLHKIHIEVNPDFNGERLWSGFTGIFQVRLVHIMIVGAHIMVWIIRGYLNGRTAATRESVQPPHRGVNENCYAKY